MKPNELGRNGPEKEGVFRRVSPYDILMKPSRRASLLFAVVVLLLVGTVSLVTVAGGSAILEGNDTDSGGQTIAALDTSAPVQEGTTEPGAGAQLSGLVSVTDQAVRGTVDEEAFQSRLEQTDSPERRVAILDTRVVELEQQVTRLETAYRSLEEQRQNGSIDRERYTAEAATINQQAASVEGLLNVSERALSDVPAQERDERNLSVRIEGLRERASQLQSRTSGASDVIDGVGQPGGAEPLTPADIRSLANSTLEANGAADRLFGSERMDVHVRKANGETLLVGIITEDGEVAEMREGGLDDPTVRIYTDYEVVRNVQRSDSPVTVINEAIDDERIVYDGDGFVNSVRYGAIDVLDSLGDLLWIRPATP